MRFTNLFIGYNKEEDFRILICAFDKIEAKELATMYAHDSSLTNEFVIKEAETIDDVHFDCDYVIA